jgi:hypothetical protein
MLHRLFAAFFPAWSDNKAAREIRATKARDAAFVSFQKMLKEGGYNDPARFRKPVGTVDQPACDTHDAPSANPTGDEASTDGAKLRKRLRAADKVDKQKPTRKSVRNKET